MRSSIGYRLGRYLISTKLMPVALSPRTGFCQLSCLSHSLRPPPLLNNINVQQLRMASNARQNFHEKCEAGLNQQINLELYASYVYMSMASHFDRDDVALPGFHNFFKKLSDEEREHAEKLMKYQNKRGGRLVLQDIRKPEQDEWGSGLDAMNAALDLEKFVNQALLDLHKVAENQVDVQFDDFLEEEFLQHQVDSIKQLADYVTQLKRVGPGLGEYQFDKETLQEQE